MPYRFAILGAVLSRRMKRLEKKKIEVKTMLKANETEVKIIFVCDTVQADKIVNYIRDQPGLRLKRWITTTLTPDDVIQEITKKVSK